MNSFYTFNAPAIEELEEKGFELYKDSQWDVDILKYDKWETVVRIEEDGWLSEIEGHNLNSYNIIAKMYEFFSDFKVYDENGFYGSRGLSEEEKMELLIKCSNEWKKEILSKIQKD